MKSRLALALILCAALISGSTYGQSLRDPRVGVAPKFSRKTDNNYKAPVNGAKHNLIKLPGSSGLAYGYSFADTATFSVPLPEGTPFTRLAHVESSGVPSSMFKGGDGNYYVLDLYFPALLQFIPSTGEMIYLGDIPLSPSETMTGMSYNPADGNYYGCTTRALYRIDKDNLLVSYIGGFNITDVKMVNLCFDATGKCYAYDVALDQSYTVDVNTGTATVLGSLGYDAEYAQGMTYDYQTETIYLSAYNKTTETAQLRTLDPLNGSTRLVVDWGVDQIAPFASASPFYPVDIPSNPIPADGATGVSSTLPNLRWDNGEGTTKVEIYFGTEGDMQQVYSGPAITSWTLSNTLDYNIKYNWKVVCKNDTITTHGGTWSFTTEKDPSFNVVFNEKFENLDYWTPIGPLGMTNWSLSATSNAGGTSPEVKLSWNPQFDGLSQLKSATINSSRAHTNKVKLKYKGWWSADPAPHIGIAVTYDEGTTSTSLWDVQPTGDMGPDSAEVTFNPTADNYQLILYCNGDSYNISFWYLDNVYVEYDMLTGIGESDNSVAPDNYSLSQNYPNPFNPNTTIRYTIGSPQFVSLKVYDALGSEIATLVDKEMPAGSYEVSFPDAVNNLRLSSGIYFYQLRAGDFISTKKCVFIK